MDLEIWKPAKLFVVVNTNGIKKLKTKDLEKFQHQYHWSSDVKI